VSLGVYIHIPFCRSKCHYCHFISQPYDLELAEKYNLALLGELALYSSPKAEVDSIYFGGGTPSILPERQIASLISECQKQYIISADCEISLEANPGSITNEKACAFYDFGINRISLGAQSFNDTELTSIGRIHNSSMIFKSAGSLKKAHFSNINLDLMLGLPFQTAESWNANLQKAADLSIPHLSVYMLELDDQAPLQSMISKGAIPMPDEDLVSDLYLETIERLSCLGYKQYEISNFAQPGFECRHNLKYWERIPVLGFGLGSHSFDGTSRYANDPDLAKFIDKIGKGQSPVIWKDLISETQAVEEALFLGLRLRKGIDWEQLRKHCDCSRQSFYESLFRRLIDQGWIEWTNPFIRLTRQGMLFSNEVFQLFI
jgi:oxygen-independent coproporphyrinogen-3 oxidase